MLFLLLVTMVETLIISKLLVLYQFLVEGESVLENYFYLLLLYSLLHFHLKLFHINDFYVRKISHFYCLLLFQNRDETFIFLTFWVQ